MMRRSSTFFCWPDVNLTEKNNAAADYLIGRFGNRISLHDDFAFSPLVERDSPGITSPFGLYIAEGIGLRFSELGYKVWLHNVATQGNASLYPAPPVQHRARIIIKGTYAVKQKNVEVHLRMINVKTSQVIGHFDYTMPVTREIRDMSKTDARIFRVQK